MRPLLIVLACALALSACGGDDNDKSSDSSANTPAATTAGGEPSAAVVGKLKDACKATLAELDALEPFPDDLNPEKPGKNLVEVGKFLDRTDPQDKIEQELLNEMNALATEAGGTDAFLELRQAMGAIIQHEVARNQAAMDNDESEYFAENEASQAAYVSLAQAAKDLKAPDCALGQPLPVG